MVYSLHQVVSSIRRRGSNHTKISSSTEIYTLFIKEKRKRGKRSQDRSPSTSVRTVRGDEGRWSNQGQRRPGPSGVVYLTGIVGRGPVSSLGGQCTPRDLPLSGVFMYVGCVSFPPPSSPFFGTVRPLTRS